MSRTVPGAVLDVISITIVISKKPSKGKSSPLADFIRQVVNSKYSTQLEASVALSVNQSPLSNILIKKFPPVSEEVVIKICKKLGLSSKEGISRLYQTRELKVKQFLYMP